MPALPVLLVSNNPGLVRKVAQCAALLGWPVEVATKRVAAFGRGGGLRGVHALAEPFAQSLAALYARLRPQLVMGVDVWGCGRVAELARLDPGAPCAPASPPELLGRLDDKIAFMDIARAAGAPVPRSLVLSARDHAPALLSQLGYPVVLKTPLGESGRGVAVVADEREARMALARAPFSDQLPLQAQQYVAGPVLGLSLLARDGEILAKSGYRKLTPERFRFQPQPDVEAAVRPLLAATRFSGLANFDAIGTADGPVLLEMNPRAWYNIQADALMGLNYVAAAAQAVRAPGETCAAAPQGDWMMPMALVRGALRLERAALAAGGPSWRGLRLALAEAAARLAPGRTTRGAAT